MNHKLAIKQYSRSSADQEVPLPHELRPVEVLQLTIRYLMHQIINMCDHSDVSLLFGSCSNDNHFLLGEFGRMVSFLMGQNPKYKKGHNTTRIMLPGLGRTFRAMCKVPHSLLGTFDCRRTVSL